MRAEHLLLAVAFAAAVVLLVWAALIPAGGEQ